MPNTRSSRSERWVAAVLIAAVAVVAAWELAARWSRRRWDPFTEASQRIAGYEPAIPGWQIETTPAGNDPLMPTFLALHATRPGVSGPILTRLSHGYNMVDCMRIKHYQVQLLDDTRSQTADRGPQTAAPSTDRHTPSESAASSRNPTSDIRYPLQIWLLTSDIGDESLWITTMLAAEGFTPTNRDTRDMAFPRIGTPDDPDWAPKGLKLSSFKRPIYNLKRLLRAKWNGARCDLLTFLRLRQPSYASRDLYTLVTTATVPPGPADALPARRASARAEAQAVHTAMLQSLHAFGTRD